MDTTMNFKSKRPKPQQISPISRWSEPEPLILGVIGITCEAAAIARLRELGVTAPKIFTTIRVDPPDPAMHCVFASRRGADRGVALWVRESEVVGILKAFHGSLQSQFKEQLPTIAVMMTGSRYQSLALEQTLEGLDAKADLLRSFQGPGGTFLRKISFDIPLEDQGALIVIVADALHTEKAEEALRSSGIVDKELFRCLRQAPATPHFFVALAHSSSIPLCAWAPRESFPHTLCGFWASVYEGTGRQVAAHCLSYTGNDSTDRLVATVINGLAATRRVH
jgi:hypothetical protein